MTTKTHWKKNNDSRYISGEDLQAELHGLKKEMVTKIIGFEDSETFDQNQNKNVTRTGLKLHGVYKPLILNNTNARWCEKEFGSPFMEDWLNKPCILFAQMDKRHGFVARLKKYYPPQISDANAIKALTESTDLQKTWMSLTAAEKQLPTVIALKEKLKNENSQSNTAQ